MGKRKRWNRGLQTTQSQVVELSQPFWQAAVQSVSKPSTVNNRVPIYRFLCKPDMRTRWMAGAAPHKGG